MMRLSQFGYTLPRELVAQYPLFFRDEGKLLVLHKRSGKIENKKMLDIVDYFSEGDSFVFNDTKVFPALMQGIKSKTFASIGVFLQRQLGNNPKLWDIQVQPARKIRVGNKLYFEDDTNIVAEVVDNTTSRGRTVRFLSDYEEDFIERLFAIGTIPLPDYIERPLSDSDMKKYKDIFGDLPVEKMDEERLQNIFARHIGSVEATASSLNFSKNLIKRLELAGVNVGCLTSHIGLGLSKPIEVEDLYKHRMDSDPITVDEHLAQMINASVENKRKICAVGVDVARCLETIVGINGLVKAYEGWTNLFVFPPFNFSIVNAFVSNFFMPYSPKYLFTCAYGGFENVCAAYEMAIKKKYRFGVYGDTFLILDD